MADDYVLVTGGAGYIGVHTVVELLNANYKVVVVDSSMLSVRRAEEITGKQVPSLKVNLLDKKAIRNVFQQYNISIVMHFAGVGPLLEFVTVAVDFYERSIEITANLLEVMKEFDVKNLIFSSSAMVYGPPQYLPVDENHPTGDCTHTYGKTKYLIEKMLQDVCNVDKTWKCILLRYFNVVGAHKSGMIGEIIRRPKCTLMPYIVEVVLGKRTYLTVYGDDYDTPDGTAVRDYIHVVDVAKGHMAAIDKLKTDCGCVAYNLGTGTVYSVLDVVKVFEKATGKTITLNVVPRLAGHAASVYVNPEKAEKELGWKTTLGLNEMCEDLLRWLSNSVVEDHSLYKHVCPWKLYSVLEGDSNPNHVCPLK